MTCMTAAAPSRATPWVKVDAALMHNHGLMPWQIDELTLIEILLFLEELGPEDQSQDDFQAALASWQNMTPKQRLFARRAGLR